MFKSFVIGVLVVMNAAFVVSMNQTQKVFQAHNETIKSLQAQLDYQKLAAEIDRKHTCDQIDKISFDQQLTHERVVALMDNDLTFSDSDVDEGDLIIWHEPRTESEF